MSDIALDRVLNDAIVTLAAILLGVPLLSLGLTWLAIPALKRIGAHDVPNERSSHGRPVPRGGGIVPVGILVVVLALLDAPPGLELGVTVAAIGLVALSSVGLWDDLEHLPVWPRLAAQGLGIVAVLCVLPSDMLVFQGLLTLPLDRVLAGILWLWFVNLYNFMDGIDGLAAGQTAMIGLGLVIVLVGLALSARTEWIATMALALATAAAGFLRWNWPPAKVFLGDAGSVPLGYLVGFLLLATAAVGPWQAALILPMYFLGDATATMIWRVARGERFWRAHNEHAYQVAVRHGRTHRWVTMRVLALDAWLIALAGLGAFAERWAWPALGLAVVSVAATLWYFRAQRRHDR